MKILVLSNSDVGIYNFRKELLKKLVDSSNEVYISLPYGDNTDYLISIGCECIDTNVDRRGINPVTDLKLIINYLKLLKKIKPDVVLSYTVKPNMYGGIGCKLLRIPFLPNITGLGTGINKNKIVEIILKILYKLSLDRQHCIFAQNDDILDFLKKNKIYPKKFQLIPGSGVNLEDYCLLEYPNDETVNFFFIARVMKEKGIEEYIEAAKHFKDRNVKFHVFGFCEEAYEEQLKQFETDGVLTYHGMCNNLVEHQVYNSCTIQPSYHEGMSNVILETSACGRPCLCSDIPGCREAINDGETGFLFEAGNVSSLINAIEKFLNLSYEQRKQMGLKAREKMEKEFDRQIVIDKYINEINKIKGEKS